MNKLTLRIEFADSGHIAPPGGQLLPDRRGQIRCETAISRLGLTPVFSGIFFDRRGSEIESARVIGYKSAERFLPTLIQVENVR